MKHTAAVGSNGSKQQTVTVDLHCHSDVSDGYCPPAQIPRILEERGVQYAALTDHQNISGILPFSREASRRGITVITGAEITTVLGDEEVHLLAYGFNPEDASLQQLFSTLPDTREALETVHAAGGLAFLAHPLQYGWSDSRLEERTAELAQTGLDGIEAYYAPYDRKAQNRLADIADRHGLLTSGGSDFHGTGTSGSTDPGAQMPAERWRQFADALGTPADPAAPFLDQQPGDAGAAVNWQWLLLRIALPLLAVITAFMVLIFGVLLPAKEESLLERKRETVRELTNSAWSILDYYHREAEAGNMELDAAQQEAAEHIRSMRYGPERLDYFWITDMHPVMIMHPYREDLVGKDLRDYRDPDGVRLFVEFVRQVRLHDAGFVRYVWQWQDDPERMEPKESYVRSFAPWDWIIGTGLYVDDVSQEITEITDNMVDISFLITLAAAALLMTVVYQGLKIEQKRSVMHQELRRSHERYRTLVESSSAGTMLTANGTCSYANSRLLDYLGYSASELAFLTLDDLFSEDPSGTDSSVLGRLSREEEIPEPAEVRIRKKNGNILPVLLSAAPVYFSGRRALLVSLQDITRHRAVQSEAERERLIRQLQSSQLFLTEPVSASMEPPVTCRTDDSVREAAAVMNQHDSDAVLVLGTAGSLEGIITDEDIRKHAAQRQTGGEAPVTEIMSAPVVTVSEQAPVFEAFLLEQSRNIEHLAVTDASGKLTGLIKSSRTVRSDRYSLLVIIQSMQRSSGIEELSACVQRAHALAAAFSASGALPEHICQVTSAAADAAVRRIVGFALEELGPPPGAFAFAALGSEARREQTLATDQDNALIFDDALASDSHGASYFLNFGELVCDYLRRVGYRRCRGETMASNPRWNQPLTVWKQYFSSWISQPDDDALAKCKVFFDQRFIWGDSYLMTELKRHIRQEIGANRAFLSHMALNTLSYKPPLGMFGQLRKSASGNVQIDIKEGMLPVVNFARMYAYRYHIEATGTLERLEKLREGGHLQELTFRSVSQAYEFLMQLRLRHQVYQISASLEPDNTVDLKSLTDLEQGMLKHSLAHFPLIQNKVKSDFPASRQS